MSDNKNCWDIFRNNKKILDEVNEAVDIFNNPTGKDDRIKEFQTAMAYGAILMEEIICEEFRKYKQVLPIQTKERQEKIIGALP